MDTVAGFTDGLPAGRPFVLTLTDEEISRWIAVRADVWPGAGEWVPDYAHDPVVAFQPERVLFGARIDRDGWQAIVSARLTVDVRPETITVRLDGVACGSCPLPVSLLAGRLSHLITATDTDVDTLPDPMAEVVRFFRRQGNADVLTRGVTIENRLFWKPSERWFRIRSLRLEQGSLRAEIEPLGSR
jgi:hypothetical protein